MYATSVVITSVPVALAVILGLATVTILEAISAANAKLVTCIYSMAYVRQLKPPVPQVNLMNT